MLLGVVKLLWSVINYHLCPYAAIQTTSFSGTSLLISARQYQDWPVCCPDLSPTENVWRIMERKIWQRGPRTVEQLKPYIKQEWERILLSKLPTISGEHDSIPAFLEHVAAIKSERGYIYKKCISLKVKYFVFVQHSTEYRSKRIFQIIGFCFLEKKN